MTCHPLADLLAALHRADTEDHARAPAPSDGTGRLRNTSRPPLPVDLLDHLVEIDRLLREWCDLVRVKREVHGPATTSSASLTRWLAPHVDWIEREVGEDFHVEISRAAFRLTAILDGDGASRRSLGPCQVDGCEGSLRPSTRNGLTVFCDRCGDEWDPGSLPRLGMILSAQQGRAVGSGVGYNRADARRRGSDPHDPAATSARRHVRVEAGH